MQVKSYMYLVPNEDGIVEDITRDSYMTAEYLALAKDYLDSVTIDGKCAVLYAGGVLLSASETRNIDKDTKYREEVKVRSLCIKEIAAYSMHKWIGRLPSNHKVEYANINGNTCASGMHSIYEAERLLNEGFDEVIIIGEEKTSYSTLSVFDEMNIDLKVGEGLAILHLHKGEGVTISDTKWAYAYNRNPFGTTSEGYSKVYTACDIVNPHGTGTDNNEAAEKAIYTDTPQLRYKEKYGHTQGISGLLEVCLVLDEDVTGDVLCVSAGLGGFFGSCIVQKG